MKSDTGSQPLKKRGAAHCSDAEVRRLEETWRRYEFIVNTSRDFMTLIDSNFVYVAANNSYCAALNRKRGEIVNSSVSDIWGEQIFNNIIRPHLEECFKGSEVHYQADIRFPESGLRSMDITYYPYRNDKEIVTHAVVVSRDITEQKSAEKELLALKKAVETMQLGVTISDTTGKILYTNPAEAALHGYSVEELSAGEVKLFAPSDLWKTRTLKSLNEIKSWRRESVNVRKDGSVFPVQLMSDVVRNQDDLPIGIVTTCEDITERKKAEDEIRKHIDHLTTLREIDMMILSSFDLRVILHVLLNHVLGQLNMHAAVIMLLNPHTLTLEYAESRGFRSHSIRNARFRLGEGLAGRVAMERRIVCIPDLRKEDIRSGVGPVIEEEGLTTYYGLPLIAKGNVKGTLEIFHRTHIDPDPEWLDFMEALAAQTAIAIDNATMFNDLQRTNIDLSLAYDTTLDGWSKALDLRDKETEGHSLRVTEITLSIARALGISETELVHVRRGALLHDIGKMGIPDNILLKPGPLNEEEWTIMRLHPVYAHEMLSPINFLRPALDIPFCHHEKWNGTGYPRGLKGREIPLSARIFSIADVWDALCSSRSYRPAFTRQETLDHICSLEGTHFDPEILRVFLDMFRQGAA